MGKLWKVKRGGRFIGSWRVTVKGREINLGTKDATEALRRARLAARGLWPQEETAAASLDAAFAAVAPEIVAPFPVGASPISSAGDAKPLPPGVHASTGGEGAPLVPDVMPASTDWAADASAAAAEESPPAAGVPGGVNLSGFDLDGLMTTAAGLLVDLQLSLQARAIRRYGKREAGAVGADDPLRKLAVEGWRQQLKIWIPADIPLPPWVVGLAMAAACGATQYATSTPIPAGGASA